MNDARCVVPCSGRLRPAVAALAAFSDMDKGTRDILMQGALDERKERKYWIHMAEYVCRAARREELDAGLFGSPTAAAGVASD